MNFVGRDAELARAVGALERAPATGLVGVLLTGEPGIGKSMLMGEAATRLAARGWRRVDVRADVLERRIPYAALDAALRGFGPALADGFTEGLRRDAVAALQLSEVEPADQGVGAGGPWFGRACAAVTRLLTALAAVGPVLLTVDDLHELDDDSAALLAVVLRRLTEAPIAVIATARARPADGGESLAQDLVAQLAAGAELTRVVLEAVPEAELAGILGPLLGGAPEPALVAEVHRRADGNPFFATEIARSLVDAGLVTRGDAGVRLVGPPEDIRVTRRDALLRRVVPLAAGARAVARAVAVFRRIRLDQTALLARIAGQPEAEVVAAFDDLLRSGVLVEDAGRTYRFEHELIAEALHEAIGPAERRMLHRLVADALAADRADGLDVDLLELAWHVSESAQPGDTVAVDVLAEAARLTRLSAPERTASLCARALELAPEPGRRGELLALRCRALSRASRPAAAVAPGLEALALLPPGAERVRTAIAVLSCLHLTARLDEAIALADAEIAAGGAPIALQAQRAVLLALARRTEEARAEAKVLDTLAAASPAEAVVLNGQLVMLSSLLARQDRMTDYADRALAAAAGNPTLELQALAVGASAEALAAVMPAAEVRLRRAERCTASGGGEAFRAEITVARIAVDWLRGRWDAALEGLPRAAAEFDAQQQRSLTGAVTAIELDIRSWRGELGLAQRLLERAVPALPNMANMRAIALVGYQLARGELEAARATIAAAIFDDGWQDLAAAPYSCVLLGRLVDLELEAGRRDAAETALAMLVEVATPRASPWSIAVLHRAVGIVRRDGEALRRAIEVAGSGGLAFEEARARLALGEFDATALGELDAAYRAFQRLGADGLRRRTGQRLRELGAPVPRARPRTRGLLSETEEKVARLVQQGMRNREIAAALHYSPRSVEVYLSRIYAKLHISSRLELARALDAHRLDEPPAR